MGLIGKVFGAAVKGGRRTGRALAASRRNLSKARQALIAMHPAKRVALSVGVGVVANEMALLHNVYSINSSKNPPWDKKYSEKVIQNPDRWIKGREKSKNIEDRRLKRNVSDKPVFDSLDQYSRYTKLRLQKLSARIESVFVKPKPIAEIRKELSQDYKRATNALLRKGK